MTFSQEKWSLKDLYPGFDSPELEASYAVLDEQITAFEAFRSKLKADMDAEDFMEILEASEKSTRIAHKLYSFAGLAFTANTQDQVAQSAQSRAEQFLAEVENRTLFFNLWWKDLDTEIAEHFMDVAGDYRYYLEKIRNFKPHTLSEAEEKIINIKNTTGSNALVTLYDAITNRYVYTLEVEGEEKEMTRGELMTYVRDSDPDLRAAAYQELYRVYAEDGPILGQMYQTRARDWGNENLKLRNFTSPISARNLGNDIPDEAVDTLLNVCEKNADVFQRYFKLKAKHLGIEKLRRYDLYAPVIKSEKKYDFNNAVKMVLQSFSAFDPKFADLAKRVFDDNHLDSEVRQGKRGGAFCWSVTPDMSPWVMLNYQGNPDDVATMAHELGHAIHAMLAEDHNIFTFHSSLPLAETASTFGEMMLVDQLLENETNETVRRDLLFRQVDNSYATIMRQAFFALFERQAHKMVTENASVDEIAEAYMKNLAVQFGDSIEVSEEFKWEWVSIPHIYHTPFYVYAYAFGQLLVLSLYKQFKEEGESFKPRYIKLLSTGGSEAPEKILKEAGIDIRDANFWQGGFEVIKDLVKQLEELSIG
ncbi:MAG TPA: M3 family oligoendopeptidase [Anaerolineales bacterium]|nr:M3 family oligoendopeptidase [Anaerolineales bacterium]